MRIPEEEREESESGGPLVGKQEEGGGDRWRRCASLRRTHDLLHYPLLFLSFFSFSLSIFKVKVKLSHQFHIKRKVFSSLYFLIFPLLCFLSYLSNLDIFSQPLSLICTHLTKITNFYIMLTQSLSIFIR